MQINSRFEKLKRIQNALPNIKSPRVNFGDLKDICKRPINDFHVYKGIGELEKINTVLGPCFFKDNGAKILVVAHLDTVLEPHWAGVLTMKHDTHIYSTTLDDRLGVYVALDMLNRANIQYDILLTTNEEKGESSASWFEPPEGKEYNWIVEFDRRGTDAVTYQYRDLDWHNALKTVGFDISHGSYSDITELSHLGVCGVNIGIGYHNNHAENCYGSLNEIRSQVSKFLDFYHTFSEVKFKYSPKFNTVTKAGFKFSPYVSGRFSDEELELAVDYYEQLKDGASYEDLGFHNTYEITKENIHLGKDPHDVTAKKVIRGSEDEQAVIIFPAPFNINAKEAAAKLKDQGFNAKIVEKCCECGRHFEVDLAHTYPYCPACQKIKDDLLEHEDEKLLAEYDKKLTIEHEESKQTKENLNKDLINSAIQWLEIEDRALPDRVGMAFKMVREYGTPIAKVKSIYDTLVGKGLLRKQKGKAGYSSNYPQVNRNEEIKITQKAMGALMDSEGFSLKDIHETSFQKWISRVESGHESFYGTPEAISMLEYYNALLRDYVSEDWIPVLDTIVKLGPSISRHAEEWFRVHGHSSKRQREELEVKSAVEEDIPIVTSAPPLEMEEETKAVEKAPIVTCTLLQTTQEKDVVERIVFGIKFKLNTDSKDYNFTQDNSSGELETKWVRVDEENIQKIDS